MNISSAKETHNISETQSINKRIDEINREKQQNKNVGNIDTSNPSDSIEDK